MGQDGEDSGRPATKQFVESLRVKIQQLESEIAQLRKQPQAPSSHTMSPHPPSVLSDYSPVPAEPIPATQTQAKPLLHLHAPTELPHLVQSTKISPIEIPLVNLPPKAPALRYQYIFNIDTSIPLDEQYPAHRASLVCQWNRNLPDLSPIYLSQLEHDIILSRCFSYGACCSFSLLPDIFLAQFLECLGPEAVPERMAEGSRYYTPLLHCSLLTFGAGFSDNPQMRERKTREKLATHAKKWLDDEFNNPSSSLMEWPYGRLDSVGPILFDPLIRDWHLCWLFDRIESLMHQALEMNRPSEYPVPKAPIICPIAVEPDSRSPLTSSLTELLTHEDYFKFSARCFIQLSRLINIIIRITDGAVTDKQIILDIQNLVQQPPRWSDDSSTGDTDLPPILTLHITYWCEPVRELSIKMCARATEKLVQLFNTFDKQFGLRFFLAIHACGSALVIERDSASSASKKKRAAAIEGIDSCIYALKIIGEVWYIAIPMSEDLESLAGVDLAA
ncbi:nitrogen assimilation transcription factor [Rhizoctonia solani]|uniref:Nitrogen assimilation transcription factor n=1 Tax=Rhizoctonia solani TaxID=456999 RepID=A0A8H7IEW8_9AGAM|nr:nitrogen assimilation transcription factor [Rhizoctonia solani]